MKQRSSASRNKQRPDESEEKTTLAPCGRPATVRKKRAAGQACVPGRGDETTASGTRNVPEPSAFRRCISTSGSTGMSQPEEQQTPLWRQR
jgi:hypothetical protein